MAAGQRGRYRRTRESVIMSSDNKSPSQSVNSPSLSPSSAGASRRQLLKGAGAASPVVLTMVSAPVRAADLCLNPSGFISQNTFNSRHPGGTPHPCTTNGPSYFNALGSRSWPSGVNKNSTKFNDTFGGTSFPTSTTLADVLTGSDLFAKYCVAAYLNTKYASPPPGFPMTNAQALAMWPTIRGGSPTTPFPPASLGWDETKTLAWLATVMSP